MLWSCTILYDTTNLIDGVLASVFASSVVDRGLQSRSSQAKDFKVGICCFSAKHIEHTKEKEQRPSWKICIILQT